MTPIPKGVVGYYNDQTGPRKELLLEMRLRILEVAPGSEEVIKYSMPTFVLNGTEIAGLKVNKNHVVITHTAVRLFRSFQIWSRST